MQYIPLILHVCICIKDYIHQMLCVCCVCMQLDCNTHLLTTNSAMITKDEDISRRLDCAVCGKDCVVHDYVRHLRECIQRNEEFSHSTVTQNPGLCNVLSRRSNRYCSQGGP
jgi:hypothetical protein